jgi:transcription antitermination factor NusA-like protein
MIRVLTFLLLSTASAQDPTPVPGARPAQAEASACEGLSTLLKQYVPAIAEGQISVTACAIEPDYGAKIVVKGETDPVEAVVGPEGAHIRAVVQAMDGLRIDVVPHFDDPAVGVLAA